MSRRKRDSRPPAFQFYPKDFVSDENVAVMTMAERGIYITLLCFCWLEESIPNDPIRAARLCGTTKSAMEKAWPVVSARFVGDPDNDSRLRHPRLEEERRKQREWAEKSGKGGKTRAENAAAAKATGTPAQPARKVQAANVRDIEAEVEQVRQWLFDYMHGEWPMPDLMVSAQIVQAMNGATLDDLKALLHQLHRQKRRPERSWNWFTAVIREHFAQRGSGGAPLFQSLPKSEGEPTCQACSDTGVVWGEATAGVTAFDEQLAYASVCGCPRGIAEREHLELEIEESRRRYLKKSEAAA